MDLLAGCLNSPALTIQRFNQSLGEARIPVTRCEPFHVPHPIRSIHPFRRLPSAFLFPSFLALRAET